VSNKIIDKVKLKLNKKAMTSDFKTVHDRVIKLSENIDELEAEAQSLSDFLDKSEEAGRNENQRDSVLGKIQDALGHLNKAYLEAHGADSIMAGYAKKNK
jgi:hypothetical protein